MPVPGSIKPSHKAIAAYYRALRAYSDQQITHEGAVETAFQQLLADTARSHGWMLVPKLPVKRAGKTIVPDGTVRDDFNLHRGYWEAKDGDDDLPVEIAKKTARRYPLTNTIFEDTRRAVLFQNGHEALNVDLTDAQQLADLLNAFYGHTEPNVEGFERAVGEFQERVPDLALALTEKIRQAHRDNARFQSAFADFMALCQSALNPNISQAAVDEMLVQHLLTERLIRKIFDNPEFTQRNVIAAEVEKVIAALVSKSFNRDEFLKSLDRFYRAIEDAARLLEDFSEKQHFLNTVYERFFQGYSVKVADTHGIVYTPQQIVDFMCSSVVEVLETEFGTSLADKDVHILDPCTGTGNFIVNLLRRIPKKHLGRMYREQLFANEVMLLPYYIAALNIEHAYYELAGDYESFPGLCFVDTLDLADGAQRVLSFMTKENTARVAREKSAPITVILGNPPYNVGQLNENDNNKNRKYEIVDRRVKDTYAKDSKATSVSKLNDPYVKFFRWSADRLEGRDGIVCFVSNNSFVDQLAFDSMRKSMLRDFTHVYHLHLEGNVRQNPKLAGTAYNVFGIQVGVGITIAIRRGKAKKGSLRFFRVDKSLRREDKLALLGKLGSLRGVKWKKLTPDERDTWLVSGHAREFATYIPIGTKLGKWTKGGDVEAVFKSYSLGVATHRDSVVYDFDEETLATRMVEFTEAYNSEVDRYRRSGGTVNPDQFVRYETIIWDRDLKRDLQRGNFGIFERRKLRTALYRPFTKRSLYFDRLFNAEIYSLEKIFPSGAIEPGNPMIVVSQVGFRSPTINVLITNEIPDLHLCAAVDGHHCFPFYVYGEEGADRRENITNWALSQFRDHYKPMRINKWDIFHYVYGLLHHPGYRAKFADNLKRDLPRIPFARDFAAFRSAGRKLSALHLDYEESTQFELQWIETPGVPLSYRVEKMKLAKDKSALVVNPSLTLAGIPKEAFDYRLGNRSALDWVIEQYRVFEDKPTGIRSDPNRADDPEYIVRLVGQVVRVSVETVKIVNSLPEL